MDEASQAFWAALAQQAPVIVGALIALVIAGLAALKRKLDMTAIGVGSDREVEDKASVARGNVKTPGSIKLADVRAGVKAQLSATLTGKAAMLLGVDHSIETTLPIIDKIAKQAHERSLLPKGPGDSGEHVITIPDNPLPDLPRPSGDYDMIDDALRAEIDKENKQP